MGGSAAEEAPRRSPIERQLAAGLVVVLVMAALIVVYGAVYVVSGWNGGERDRFTTLQIGFVFLLLPGIVVFFTARSARRRLKAQVVSARLYSILTGVFAMLAALPLLATVIGLLTMVVGLFTLTAALLLKRENLT